MIDLSSTIPNGKNLAPGAVGKFKIDIDFEKVDFDIYYKVFLDRTNIPNNIHFYKDENFNRELSLIEGIKLKKYDNKLA